MTPDDEKGYKNLIARKLRAYKSAREKYHKTGVAAMQKGPYSYEAEQAYPQAKYEYHKRGNELKVLRKILAKK
jgi:hypothetical protein